MTTITAAMVKDLRETTGVGMMDCKNALAANDGDMQASIDWLRKKGLSKAAKKAGRTAAEGLVGVESPGRSGAMVEVNSETDFVARNESFQAFVRETTKVALMASGSVEALEAAHMPGASATLREKLQELVATIGENMTIRRVAKLEVKHGIVATYVHNQVSEGLGKIGVMVALESEGDVGELSSVGRQIAAHIAAMNPVAVDASGVDAALLDRESAILREKNAGKPDHVLAKIVESGLKSFYKESTLLDQPFVYEPSKSVGQMLKDVTGRIGKPVALTGFVRFALGEGIEKEETDFAAEVAAQSGVGKKPDGDGAAV
jgi:elongation factor Ts